MLPSNFTSGQNVKITSGLYSGSVGVVVNREPTLDKALDGDVYTVRLHTDQEIAFKANELEAREGQGIID